MTATKALSPSDTLPASCRMTDRHYGDLRKAFFLQRRAAYRLQVTADPDRRDWRKSS